MSLFYSSAEKVVCVKRKPQTEFCVLGLTLEPCNPRKLRSALQHSDQFDKGEVNAGLMLVCLH